MPEQPDTHKQPGLFPALLPLIILIGFLTLNVILFDNTLGGANQMALILAAAVAGLVTKYYGIGWNKIQASIVNTINNAMPSMLILLLIGSLSGTWMISGVVPVMIYYGLDIIHPTIFLFAAVVVSAVVSLATGSSWSTIATIGVALLGIGTALGLNKGIVAGAIISGGYFGDKMSPLSDTTNLAPAMTGTDLFTHIRYMMFTTVPTLSITLIIFLLIGFNHEFTDQSANISTVKTAIGHTFNTTPLLFIVPGVLITIIIKKVPPIPSLIAGTLLGGLFAIVFQPDIVRNLAEEGVSYAIASYKVIMQAMFGDISLTTSSERVNELLSATGMKGMLETIWLILSAMIFGGVMEAGGLLVRITQTIMRGVKSTGSLVASTAASCIFFNVTASDQYISIVVPGRMYSKAFREQRLKPEVLSRTLEDSGTVTSVLIPWNTGGATQAKVLGVSTIAYLPYCFFNWLSPIMTILYAYLNIKIRRFNDGLPKINVGILDSPGGEQEALRK